MLARIASSAMVGIEAISCEVEVDIPEGGSDRENPRFVVVGLPDAAVKESIERVRSAINNCGYNFPYCDGVINLAPADIRKEGPCYDLPIALGVLCGAKYLSVEKLRDTVIVGELALDGRVRPVRGVLATALMAAEQGYRTLIVPVDNAREAAVVSAIDVIGVSSLSEAVGYLNDHLPLEPTCIDLEEIFRQGSVYDVDFADVKGQESAKRAITIAAAGGHNLIMLGPPGTGKTMLARRIPTILPPLTLAESLETTRVHSAVGLLKKHESLMARRPVRHPHHTASAPSLAGGGTVPRPGELSLAHHGLLFLDEFPEFPRVVLETIRQPLEDGQVTISRASGTLTFPANFMLVAAMNPCPCGYATDPKRQCKCTPNQIERYLSKISGPLIDRIDIHIDVPAVQYDALHSEREGTSSTQMRELVMNARKIQQLRLGDSPNATNGNMTSRQVRSFCKLDQPCQQVVKHAVSEMGLSARAHDKILKIARTIADLEQATDIQPYHLQEAIQYRRLDRQF
ncbi:MAG: YifB family Mg chelatase-like AAA ATPase [Sedimentisphaerales bacterium]|nr:YifB family Mg chelatase-like AAA ATPase [Sedimentisphaerales bacterium]